MILRNDIAIAINSDNAVVIITHNDIASLNLE